jgi:FMN-dependent NADH-azoreductase
MELSFACPGSIFPYEFFGRLDMSKVLLITSSLFGENSKSRQIALEVVNVLKDADPRTEIVRRDVNPVPHLNGEELQALMTAPDSRSERQSETVKRADELIEELEAADTIVVAAPMYNFSISSPLKAWIDHIARAGRTFRYTASGPEGLLKNKKVIVVASRGGSYTGAAKAMDFQEPYLRAMFGFLGLTDVTFVHLESQNISPEAAKDGMTFARRKVNEMFPVAMAA